MGAGLVTTLISSLWPTRFRSGSRYFGSLLTGELLNWRFSAATASSLEKLEGFQQ
jgi:hypothetical protein